MVEKIRDGVTGGTYEGGIRESFAVSPEQLALYPERKGVTGKFNQLVDEVGNSSDLITNADVIVDAVNEIKLRIDGAVLLDSNPQIMVGTYTFGAETNTDKRVFFNHDVEFRGSVQFNSGGNTLDLANTFISLGDDDSPNPVGDGGLVLERGTELEDVRIFWDESESKWQIKDTRTTPFDIYNQGNVVPIAQTFLETGELEARSNIVLTNSANGQNNKSFATSLSDVTGDFSIFPVSDDFLTLGSGYTMERDGVNVTAHKYYTNGQYSFELNDNEAISTKPLKIDKITEYTVDNGITVESLHFKDTTFGVIGTNNVAFTNTEAVFNPDEENIKFTIKDINGASFRVDAQNETITSFREHYFNSDVYFTNVYENEVGGGIKIHDDFILYADNVIESTSPTMRFKKTDASTNEKLWDFGGATSSAFTIKAVDDGDTFNKNAYVIGRDGVDITRHDLYVGGKIEYNITKGNFLFTDGNNDLETRLRIRSKSGYDSSISFEEDGDMKGRLLFDSSNDSLNLSKYNTTGTYIGGLVISDNVITMDTLPVNIEGILNVNAIQPLSGTTTTLNQNARVIDDLSVGGILTVDNIQNLSVGAGIDIEGFILDNGTLEARATRPFMNLIETDRIANQKTWGIESKDGDFQIYSASDDGNTIHNVLSFDRNGYGVDSVDLYTPNLTLRPRGNTENSSGVAELILDADAGNNQIIRFQKDGVLQGYMHSEHGNDRLRIGKTNALTGALQCNIDMADDSIILSDETFFLGDIRANRIFERTSDNGVNIENNVLKDGTLSLSSSKIYFAGSSVTSENDFIEFDETSNEYRFWENKTITGYATADVSTSKILAGTVRTSLIETGTMRSKGSMFFDIDSDNNSDSNAWYFRDNASTPVFQIENDGFTRIYRPLGGDILRLADTGTTSSTEANPILSFGNANGRLGYVGFGSTENTSLYINNDVGRLIFNGTGISTFLDDVEIANTTPMLFLNSADGADSRIYFRQVGSDRGLVYYDDSSDSMRVNKYNTTGDYACTMAMYDDYVNFDSLSTVRVNNNPVWHSGNDGSGSGLDADKLDGLQASAFAQVTTGTWTPQFRRVDNNEIHEIRSLRRANWYRSGNEITINFLAHMGSNTSQNWRIYLNLPFPAKDTQIIPPCWSVYTAVDDEDMNEDIDTYITRSINPESNPDNPRSRENMGTALVKDSEMHFRSDTLTTFIGAHYLDHHWLYITAKYIATS